MISCTFIDHLKRKKHGFRSIRCHVGMVLALLTTFGAREVVNCLGFPQIRFVSVAYVDSHGSDIGECPFAVFALLSFLCGVG